MFLGFLSLVFTYALLVSAFFVGPAAETRLRLNDDAPAAQSVGQDRQ